MILKHYMIKSRSIYDFNVNIDNLKCDISNEEEVKEMFNKVKEKFDKLDYLVNNVNFDDNINEFIFKCNLILPKFSLNLPKYALYNDTKGLNDYEYLCNLSMSGLSKRLNNNVNDVYRNRLLYELDIINKMGFANYLRHVLWKNQI